jgi:large conductance mechanosensitive channel
VLREFKDFVNKGNFVDLAVAFVMGVAFAAVVSTFTDRIVMPLVAVIVQLDGEQLGRFGDNGSVGAFLAAFINFVIIGFVMFLVVKAYNRFREPQPEAAPTEDVLLLRAIRDELRAGAGAARTDARGRDTPPTTPPT